MMKDVESGDYSCKYVVLVDRNYELDINEELYNSRKDIEVVH